MNKRGQGGMTTETLVGLLVLAGIAVLLVWGFSTNWWGIGKKAEAYTGGSNLAEISGMCRASCTAEQTVPYCTSDLKVVNNLQIDQLNLLKAELTGGNCYDKDNKEIDTSANTNACNTAKKGIWKLSSSELNYYTLQAKVSCFTLGEAELIDKCNEIVCA